MRRRGSLLSLGFVTLLSIASGSAVLAQKAPRAEGAKELLAAMKARIAVSFDRRSGKTIPASHCRHAPGGCEQRLAAFAQYLTDAGARFNVSPWLMAAMAFKESGFNPFALGSLGELGILQINPERKDASSVRFIRDEWYRKRCRKEPGACQREVVEHAAQLLARALQKCNGDVVDALGAYNAGRCGGKLSYAKRVLEEFGELRAAAGLPVEQAMVYKRKRPNRS